MWKNNNLFFQMGRLFILLLLCLLVIHVSSCLTRDEKQAHPECAAFSPEE